MEGEVNRPHVLEYLWPFWVSKTHLRTIFFRADMSGQLERRWTGTWGNGIVSGDIVERARAFQLSPETPWQAGVNCSESSGQSRDLGSSAGFTTKCCEHGQASPGVGCRDWRSHCSSKRMASAIPATAERGWGRQNDALGWLSAQLARMQRGASMGLLSSPAGMCQN